MSNKYAFHPYRHPARAIRRTAWSLSERTRGQAGEVITCDVHISHPFELHKLEVYDEYRDPRTRWQRFRARLGRRLARWLRLIPPLARLARRMIPVILMGTVIEELSVHRSGERHVIWSGLGHGIHSRAFAEHHLPHPYLFLPGESIRLRVRFFTTGQWRVVLHGLRLSEGA